MAVRLALLLTVCLMLTRTRFSAADEFRELTTRRSPGQHLVVRFSPDGEFVVTAGVILRSRQGFVNIWNVDSGEVVAWTDDFPVQCDTLDFSPDGTLLAVGCGDHSVHVFRRELVRRRDVWRRAVRIARDTPPGILGVGDQVRFSPDGTLLSRSCYRPGRPHEVVSTVGCGVHLRRTDNFVDSARNNRPDPIQTLNPIGPVVHRLRFLDERGDRLLISHNETGPDGPALSAVDVASNEMQSDLHLQEIEQATDRSNLPIDVSPDFTLAAFGGLRFLVLLDAETLEVERRLPHPGTAGVDGVVFLPESQILASCGSDTICLWDTESGELLSSREDRTVRDIAASPDGSQLATINRADRTVRIWDVRQMLEE